MSASSSVLEKVSASGSESRQVQDNQSSTREQGKPPGRNSIMWDAFSDITMSPFNLSVGTMQGALPAVSTAVNKTGTYRYNPQKRAADSVGSLMRFLYDGKGGGVAMQEAKDLRALHANIKGKLNDGSAYFALNPVTYRIVPDTMFDGVIRARECLGKPLNEKEKTQLFEEYTQLCLLFGIPRKYIPASQEAFAIEFNNIVVHDLEYTEAVDVILNGKFGKPKAVKPQGRKKKGTFQKFKAKIYNESIFPYIQLANKACLHPRYREIHGISWSEAEQFKFERMCRFINKTQKIVPRGLRYSPMAYAIMLGFHGPKLVTAEEVKRKEQKMLANN